MFDVSWGELLVLTGVGLMMAGPKDLPHAARVVGTQVGRMVGLLQGARTRADRFAAQHELRHLQNELRSGLRELDTVKAELALSMSSRGIVGRNLGTTVLSANRNPIHPMSSDTTTIKSGLYAQQSSSAVNSVFHSVQGIDNSIPPYATTTTTSTTTPAQQSIAAVAEQEWVAQGIGFQSRAERGQTTSTVNNTIDNNSIKVGSALLSHILQESLIYDQYDRVVHEQDQALQSKMKQVADQVQEHKHEK